MRDYDGVLFTTPAYVSRNPMPKWIIIKRMADTPYDYIVTMENNPSNRSRFTQASVEMAFKTGRWIELLDPIETLIEELDSLNGQA